MGDSYKHWIVALQGGCLAYSVTEPALAAVLSTLYIIVVLFNYEMTICFISDPKTRGEQSFSYTISPWGEQVGQLSVLTTLGKLFKSIS